MKKEKNNFVKFGGLIDAYSIDQAVKDKAVVPLLYEARHVEIEQNDKAIDTWFQATHSGVDRRAKSRLEEKVQPGGDVEQSRPSHLHAEGSTLMGTSGRTGRGRVSSLNWLHQAKLLQGFNNTKSFHQIGHVTSEVVISPPDLREGNEEVDNNPEDEVVASRERMMKRYGSEDEYNKQIVSRFTDGQELEVLIVVDKLITGIDAPRNTVMYLTRKLTGHTLLQAIARVNRLYDDDAVKQPEGIWVHHRLRWFTGGIGEGLNCIQRAGR